MRPLRFLDLVLNGPASHHIVHRRMPEPYKLILEQFHHELVVRGHCVNLLNRMLGHDLHGGLLVRCQRCYIRGLGYRRLLRW